MKLLKQSISVVVISFFILLYYGSSDNNSSSSISDKPSENKNGVYSYYENSASFKITVYQDSWSGTTKICQYCDVEYDNGIVKGTDLYDSSGFIKIGYISGNSLVTSISGNRDTLKK